MCFIIAVLGVLFGYNFFMAGKTLLALGSWSVSLLFLYFMIHNIIRVKKLKEEQKNDH